MRNFLSHHRNFQWEVINTNYWEELIGYLKKIAEPNAEFYDTGSTIEWLVESTRVGYTIAHNALKERERRK